MLWFLPRFFWCHYLFNDLMTRKWDAVLYASDVLTKNVSLCITISTMLYLSVSISIAIAIAIAISIAISTSIISIYAYNMHICIYIYITEGSLEVKLPTVWTDEKQSREEADIRERVEERRVEEEESEERRCRCAKR